MAFLLTFTFSCSKEKPPTSNPVSVSAAPTKTETAGAPPLTTDERRDIVAIVRRLESDAGTDKADIVKPVRRILEAPGFTVVLCANMIGPFLDDAAGLDLAALLLLTSAAALIEDPRVESDLPAMAEASLRSVLKIYSLHREATKQVSSTLDDLGARDEAGTLGVWVQEHWDGCPRTVAEARAPTQ